MSPNFGLRKKDHVFFFDFDNTITRGDVLDAVIEEFSIDDEWKVYEEAWEAGKIGSRECLEAQLRSVRIKQKELIEYLKTINLDPFFPRLIDMLNQRNISFVIVSDSFSFIIKTILYHHGLGRIKTFANELTFEKGQLKPSFPYVSEQCSRCAHCKKRHLLDYPDKIRVYVGDGLSDVCPALEAEKVFAKDHLLSFLQQKGKPCMPFSHLGDLYPFVESLDESLPSSMSYACA